MAKGNEEVAVVRHGMTVSMLASDRVVELHLEAKTHASVAVYCAAAAGALLLRQKAGMQHGEFGPWVETVAERMGVSSRSCYNYMGLAQGMADRIKAMPKLQRVSILPDMGSVDLPQMTILDLLAAFDPAKIAELQTAKTVLLLKNVTGEQSLRQLYFDWDICKEPKALGGDHYPRNPDGTRMKPDRAARAMAAAAEIQPLMKKVFKSFVQDKAWGMLEHKEMISYYDLLLLAVDTMRPVVEKLRAKGKEQRGKGKGQRGLRAAGN